MAKWMKKAIRQMERNPRKKRAKALKRRLKKSGDLYKGRKK